MEKIEAAKQLRVGMKTTAPCKKITPLFDNMTDFSGWAIVIQARSHQFLAGFLPVFAEKQWVCIEMKYIVLIILLNQVISRLFRNSLHH
jgi:hypothetical protein